MYIPIILGTARQGRESIKPAKFMLNQARKFGFESEIIDVKNFRISATNREGKILLAKKFSKKIKHADGLIIVSPEYNHGYPGELKMMLDMLYTEYFYKPLGICGVSSSGLGGGRMVEQLRLVSIELHMVPIREAIYFSNINSCFDKKGNLLDKAYIERCQIFFKELNWMAKTLKAGRRK